jgi:DNA-binding MarR family transcriptional regulator
MLIMYAACGESMADVHHGRNEIGYVVKRLQHDLRRALDSVLARHHLSMAQYSVLYQVSRHPAVSSAELGRLSFVTPQTTIRIVQNLERTGLLARTQSPRSSRVLETRLTRKGRGALRIAQRSVDGVSSRMLAGVPERELVKFGTLMEQMIRQLQEPLHTPASSR